MGKRPYTQYDTALRQQLRTHGCADKDELIARIDWGLWAEDRREIFKDEDQHLRAKRGYLLQCAVEELILDGRAHHLFVRGDRRFCDWLVSCVREETPLSHMVGLQDKLGDKPTVVHFPSANGLHSIAFGIYRGVAPHHMYVLCSRQATLIYFQPLPDEDKAELDFSTVETIGVKQVVDGDYYLRVAAAVAMYCDAFPDMVVEGLPEDLKHPAHHAHGDSATVGVSPRVSSGGTHASPVAHYREGHFRTLRAERYVKKRGQTVFVEGTFVKGRAKTMEAA